MAHYLAQPEMYKMAAVMAEMKVNAMIIFSPFLDPRVTLFLQEHKNILFVTIWYVSKSKDLEKEIKTPR